jgi:hypothetical protein
MKKAYKNTNKTFLWITKEWLIILIAILILLAIAIGAASARTLINPTSVIGAPSQTTSASTGGSDTME